MNKVINCALCKVEFSYRFRNDRDRKYCTILCKNKINLKSVIICPICNKTRLRSPSQLKMTHCSIQCRNLSMRNEYNGPLCIYANANEEEKLELLKRSFNERVIKSEGCWKWNKTKDKDGYGKFQFNRKAIRAHRASYIIHNGTIPKGLWVLHTCDNRECSNPDHLFLGDAKDNNKDMVNKKRSFHLYAEDHPMSKLTRELAEQIKKLLDDGKLSQRSIGKMFNVTQTTIWRIKSGKAWGNPT